jgi:large subunit ribosomal protein L35
MRGMRGYNRAPPNKGDRGHLDMPGSSNVVPVRVRAYRPPTARSDPRPDPKGTKMSKLKTKSGAKKRFKMTGTGKVRVKYAFKSHNLRKRSQKMKRQARGMQVLRNTEAHMVKKHYMPNG